MKPALGNARPLMHIIRQTLPAPKDCLGQFPFPLDRAAVHTSKRCMTTCWPIPT